MIFLKESLRISLLSYPSNLSSVSGVFVNHGYLTKSSRFIRKHLMESEESFLAMCFIFRDTKQLERRFLELALSLYDDHKETSAPDYALPLLNCELLPRLSPDSPTYLYLIGHCNGIMCLMIDEKIMLVNPSLKEMKKLPIPCGKLVGFGFDNNTMDFKVVRIWSFKSQGEVYQDRAEVYNLRSNAWRQLNEFPFVFDSAMKRSTFFNGVIHWCVKTKFFGWKMLTFNMATELFQEKEFPQGWYNNDDNNVPALFVLNQESLVFVSYQFPIVSSDFVNLWIMNKHENEEPWTKIYSIGPLENSITPIYFCKRHKFLYKTICGKLILYDLLNHRSSVICNNISQLQSCCSDTWLEMEMGVCSSSLVSINM